MNKAVLRLLYTIFSLFPSCQFLHASENFGFSEPNLFIISPIRNVQTGSSFSQNLYPAKFKIALYYKLLGSCQSRSGIYISYIQNSFLDIYNKNQLFYENNYLPSIYLRLDFTRWLEDNSELYAPTLKISCSRELNGRADSLNRFWDRITATLEFGEFGTTEFFGSFSYWKTIHVSKNSRDINRFAGDAEIRLGYWSRNNSNILKWGVSMDLCFGNRYQGFTSITTSLYYNPFNSHFKFSPAFIAEYYRGTAECLRNYNNYVNSIRIGFALM
ncbi:MAG: phospholipase A [Fibrobacter sp.]|nr:phospholipase A [Fibrobacter sp.]